MHSIAQPQNTQSDDALSQAEATEVVLHGLLPSIDRATLMEVLSHYEGIQNITLLPFWHSNRAVITFGSKQQAAKVVADLSGSAAGLALHQSDIALAGAYTR